MMSTSIDLDAIREELSLLRDAARQFIEDTHVPRLGAWACQRHVDRATWRAFGEQGLLLTDIPEEYGGAGGCFAHDAVIYDELNRAGSTAFAIGRTVHAICAHYVLNYGNETQKRRWLPKMASGELIGAIAMSEPGTGSDLKAIRTSAARDGDYYRVDGAKTFISNGQLADLVCVVVRTGAQGQSDALSLLMLETANLEGFARGRNLDKIGLKAQDTSELFFDDVRVPVSARLGEEGEGFAQLMRDLPYERTIVAVNAVAAMERAVALATEYVKQRSAFGQALIAFQNTRFTLAECATEARVARVFVDDCIRRVVAGTLDTETASMAKLWCTERQCHVVDACLQLFGGYGYMTEYPIAEMYADARVQRIYAGTNEIMKEVIARSL